MTWPLRYATAGQIIQLGPFVQYDDDTDQLIPAETLTITAGDIRLHKSGETGEVSKNSGGATHLAAGRYRAALDATDTDTLGPLRVAVSIDDALPVWLDCVVLPAAVYDSLHAGTGAGLRAEATNMRGTDAALTSLGATAPAGWLNAAAIASGAITDAKIASNAISAAKLAAGAITSAKLASGALDAVWSAPSRTLTAVADSAGVTDLLSRLTAARAAYLDKLNVAGNLSTFDHTTNAVILASSALDAIWSFATRTLTATADSAGVSTLLARLTAARAAYLDKLNVTGNLSTFDPQTHTVTIAQQFPEHFASLSIDATGRVTTANPAAVVGSLHTAQDVANLILASPANKLVTNASGEVIASNMRGTDGALTAAAYTAPNNSAIAAIKAKTDNLPASPAATADVQVTVEPVITVNPTVLSPETVTAIAAPILAAIGDIDIGDTAPSVEAIAERLLIDPANKLLTDTNGYVIAANISEENGQFQISVSITAGGSGVENVLITIPGTTRRYLTDAFGRTNIPADSGTYDLRITPPPGYEPVEDVTVTVAGEDKDVPVELVPRAIVIDPPAGTCAFTVRVASQSGTTLADIPIVAKLPKGYAVTSDTLNLNTTESQTTDSDGLATLILLRNQPYDLTAKRLDQGAVTLRIQTPNAEQATLSQVIQV